MNTKKWKSNPAMRKGLKHAARTKLAEVWGSLDRVQRRKLKKEPMGVKKFLETSKKAEG
ncbi:MAG: hypothetical protein IV100_00080 [Myxococcales bacterium]|nr:hypothetical protein [Myxococcales bacterium]